MNAFPAELARPTLDALARWSSTELGQPLLAISRRCCLGAFVGSDVVSLRPRFRPATCPAVPSPDEKACTLLRTAADCCSSEQSMRAQRSPANLLKTLAHS